MLIPIRDTAHWHELRSKNVGGSDINALYNEGFESQTKYKLWHEKSGILLPDDLSDDERIQSGNWLEPGIINWANDKWGHTFSQPKAYATHPTVIGMGCTPDGMQDDGVTCQIKKIDEYIFKREWLAEKAVITDAPLKYLLQCQYEIACLGLSEIWLIVCIGGNRLARMLVPRSPEVIALLERDVAAFWASIAAGIPPKPDYALDAATLAALRSAGTKEVVDYSGNNRLAEIIHDYTQTGAKVKRGAEHLAALAAEIHDICGTAGSVICGERRVKLFDVKGIPDHVIVPEDVGTVIKGRMGNRQFRIGEMKLTEGE